MADGYKHILVVDDDEAVRLVLREKLSKLLDGCRVDMARSGEEALRKVSERDFALIISDLCMDGIDGLTLLHKVRMINPQTRFILITAFGTEEVEARARLLYTDAYLTKPFNLQDLVDVAAQALGKMPLAESQTMVITGEFDIIEARLKVRKLATVKGFDIIDQARISLATSSLAQILGLGGGAVGRITAACVNEEARVGLQVVCVKVRGRSSDLDLIVFEDMRKMVDELEIEDLPSQDLQVTLLKWVK